MSSKLDPRKRSRRSSTTDSDDEDSSYSKKIHSDGYDDKYRGDANDRAWLKTLTERQREEELAKRHEQREILKHREEISKKLKSKVKPDDDNEPKTSTYDNDIYAENDDDDDYQSSTIRRKQINASKQRETQHSKSLQALVEERKKKQDEKIKKPLPKSNASSTSDEDEDDDGAKEKSSRFNKKKALKVKEVYQTSSSEDEDGNRKHQRSRSPEDREQINQAKESKRKKLTLITTKSQLKPMVLSRFRMEKWCHAPFFADVVKGAFVRINIGQNNGVPIYRICEVRDVVETAKIYNLGSTRTNKGLRLKHGHNERVFRLEFVSNTEMSDTEFKRWRETTIKQGVPLPTLQDVENKTKAIEKCKHYVYSNTDITKMVQEKSRFRKAPINYAMTKNELLKEIGIAEDEKDTKRENELRKKLTEMEERASELDRKRTENISAIAQINRRNRKRTQENVEMALTREAQEHKNAAADPFTRRRCAPVLVSKAPQTKEELIRELQSQRAAEEAAAAAKKKLEAERLLVEQSKTKKATVATHLTVNKPILSDSSLSTMTRNERGSFTSLSTNNDDLFNSHNFELDIHI